MNNPNPVWIYDTETFCFLAVNDAAVEHYGYTSEEFLSMSILDIRPTEEVPRLIESVKVLPERFNSSHYWQHLKKDGTLIYVNIAGHKIKYNGRQAEIVLVHDITGEIKGRREIVAAKNNIDTLINTTEDLIWSVDKDFCIISLNFAFSKFHKSLTGSSLKPGDSIFKNRAYLHSFSLDKKNYERAYKGESFAVVAKTSFNNKELTVEVRYNPIINEEGEVMGVACFSRDITAHIKNEEKITSQNRKLKEITSIASHDFRGPIASLIGLVNLFNKRDYSDAFNARIIDGIEETAYKLDNVVHRIVNKTFEVELQEASIINSAPQSR
jgi:PAS domain S-box-containing protein